MPARSWTAKDPIDLRATVGPLVRGRGDPTHRFDGAGRFWWACSTPDGPGTLALSVRGRDVQAEAWGDGAGWLLAQAPALMGEGDDWTTLDVSTYPVLQRVWRRHPGLRLCRSGRVLDSLVPAIFEQKVTGQEARRSWRLLQARFGTPAPGPADGLRVPPTPGALLDIPTWEWHRIGIDLKRQRTVRAAAAAAASAAARLEECVELPLAAAEARLQVLPGVGPWTAAEVLQRAMGHPDAVSVGDYHLKNMVVHLLTGRPRGSDEEMLELLAPWAGQRQRVMRLVELAGVVAPRFGPRFNYTDIRAI
jgi:3-methyladenine DNA glycosylase/8-oxoguanine DNA glycosylase